MAVKKYIVKQITNWNSRGEKTGTHTVQMDETEIASYVSLLDGKIEVYEQNLTLSVEASTATSSVNIVDFIRIKHSVLKNLFILQTQIKDQLLQKLISEI